MTENQKRLLEEALHHIDKAHDTSIESVHGWSGNFAQARAKIRKALNEKICCENCQYWEEDEEYKGLGTCKNNIATDMMIFGHADMFLLSGSFGCIFVAMR